MKKLLFTLMLGGAAQVALSQSWNTNLNEVTAAEDAKLGTKNAYPLRFFVNDDEKMSIDAEGNLKVHSLAGTGMSLLFVDGGGNVARTAGGTQYHCNTIVPWYVGGNMNTGNLFNTIGTCDAQDFILKAYDKNLINIKSSTGAPYAIGVGLNNNSPGALLDISDGQTNHFDINRMRIYGDADGTIEAYTTPMTLISLDGLYVKLGTKQSGTAQVFSVDGNGVTNTLDQRITGKLAINNNNPQAALDIRNAVNNSPVELLVYNNTSNSSAPLSAPARIRVGNLLTYNFEADANGIGHITEGPATFLSYQRTWLTNSPQVWVGARKPTVAPYNDFNFAVDGKLVAQSIYVIPGTTGWADYVFDKDYKLPELSDVELYYKKNKHLPEIPSAKEIEEKGINVADMNALLLKKVEELTLYVVEQQKRMDQMEKKIKNIK